MKKQNYWNEFLLVILIFMKHVQSAKIMHISAITTPSHHIWEETLAMELRNRGHNITFVTHTPEEINMENFTTIVFEEAYGAAYEGLDLENSAARSILDNIELSLDWFEKTCKHDMTTQGFQKLLQVARSGEKYDAVIMDIGQGICFCPIIELLGYPPTIATSPYGLHAYLSQTFGLDWHSSYVPNMVLKINADMSFFQRLGNYFANLYEYYLDYKHKLITLELLRKTYGRDMSHVLQIEKNFSIFLPNYDPVLEYSRPLPPNVIPVGGLHVRRNKTLQKDLKVYLDNSKQGVIIFSLGTNIRLHKIEESKRKIILDTFAKLKENIICKLESEIKELPNNVIVKPYLPQNDILNHHNVKLLINHGGSLSTQEAMIHGIPIIAIPFFVDQRSISQRIAYKGIGKTIDFETLNTEKLVETIREVIDNPKYKKNSLRLSRHYHDRPQNALDRAVFWVEHVIRNGGVGDLKSPVHGKPIYQKYLVDVWFFIVVVIIILCAIIYFFLKKLKTLITLPYTFNQKTKLKNS